MKRQKSGGSQCPVCMGVFPLSELRTHVKICYQRKRSPAVRDPEPTRRAPPFCIDELPEPSSPPPPQSQLMQGLFSRKAGPKRQVPERQELPHVSVEEEEEQPSSRKKRRAATAVGTRRRAPSSKEEYLRTLQEQIDEKRRRKEKEEAEEREYNRKIEEEAARYDYFGRSGGGAPMRRNGEVVTDLRRLDRDLITFTPTSSSRRPSYRKQQPPTPVRESEEELRDVIERLTAELQHCRQENSMLRVRILRCPSDVLQDQLSSASELIHEFQKLRRDR